MGSGVEGWEVVIGSQCEVTKFQYYVRLDASLTIAVLTIATLTVATLTVATLIMATLVITTGAF